MIRKTKREMPLLNTTSTADISFMLLIFFLVTTSMNSEKGLQRELPPSTPPDEEIKDETTVEKRDLLVINVASGGKVTFNEEEIEASAMRDKLITFIDNPNNSEELPEKHITDIPLIGRTMVSDSHVIQITAERDADYDTYFNVQNEIVAAYRILRDRKAKQVFKITFEQCTDKQKEAVKQCYPHRVAENYL